VRLILPLNVNLSLFFFVAAGEWEAPGLIEDAGIYYLIVSDKTGYRSNPNKMFYATGLTGTWTGPFDIAPPELNTYNSQNTHELPIFGSQKTTWIYMGDQWTKTGDADSNYVWLPIIIDSGQVRSSLVDSPS
jgi:hypothetical protein